jgi:hypothetical protein
VQLLESFAATQLPVQVADQASQGPAFLSAVEAYSNVMDALRTCLAPQQVIPGRQSEAGKLAGLPGADAITLRLSLGDKSDGLLQLTAVLRQTAGAVLRSGQWHRPEG